MQLEPDQLEAVFDSLDMDSNGYVTFDEFCLAFGNVITIENQYPPHSLLTDRSITESPHKIDS